MPAKNPMPIFLTSRCPDRHSFVAFVGCAAAISALALTSRAHAQPAADPAVALPSAAAPPDPPGGPPPPRAPMLVAPQPLPAVPLARIGGPPGSNEPISPLPAPHDDYIDDLAVAHDGHPTAGYHNGLFFLRDHHDNFHLYVQGRSQIDFYSYLGRGVSDTALKPTLFLRRVRPEVTGEFLDHWRFMIAGDFGATALDNPRGSNEVAAASPGAAPTAGTAKFAAADATRFQAAATDVFLNFREGSLFNIMVGQFDAPFTMENRTSDKYIPFMERSLAVRAVGIPTNKELGAMFWGETQNRLWFYSLGLFNGDGQNRPNVDGRGDLMARTFIHPLAQAVRGPVADSQIGASVRYGSRDKDWVNYDYPGLATQGNYQFWQAAYAGANGTNHVIPSGDQLGIAGELRIPFEWFDITSEVVWIRNNTREAQEGFEATRSDRFGNIHGVSYYAQVGFWPLGNRDINGIPGYGNPPRLDWSKSDPLVPKQALQLLAKWEQLSLTYQSANRAGAVDTKNVDGDIKVNALSLGVNYWATRHVRLSLDYIMNMFPDSAPVKATTTGGPQQTSQNRALAPGNTLATGVNDSARDSANTLHEILMRFAIAL